VKWIENIQAGAKEDNGRWCGLGGRRSQDAAINAAAGRQK